MADLARAVFEHAADGILLIDRERRIRAMNPAAERLLGCDARHVVDHAPCHECLLCREPGGTPLTGCRCLAVAEGQPLPYFEMTVRGAGGADIPVSVSAARVPVDGEEWIAVVLRDISHQRQLYGLSRDLATVADFDTAVSGALDRVRSDMGLDVAGLLELDENQEYLYYRVLSGTRLDFSHVRIPVSESLHGPVIVGGQTRVIPDLPAEVASWHGRAPLLGAEGIRSAIFLPLQSRGKILGSLVLGTRHLRNVTPAELETLQAMATLLATAFDNYRLYARLRDQAVAEERQRLAREIHDSLAQTIAIIGQRVRQLPKVLTGDKAEVTAFTGALERVVEQAYREVRQAIFDLKSPVGLGSSFVESLMEYLEDFSLIHRLPVDVISPQGTDFVVPLQVEVQLFRIIQEALNNVRRHSGANRATIRFVRRGAGLMSISVEDNGVGFDPAARKGKGHYGLQIMQERAKAIGGILTVRSSHGRGTTVELEIPLTKE